MATQTLVSQADILIEEEQDMTIKISTMVQSHLNDIAVDIYFDPTLAAKRTEFVKYILFMHRDLNQEVEPIRLYAAFVERFPQYRF